MKNLPKITSLLFLVATLILATNTSFAQAHGGGHERHGHHNSQSAQHEHGATSQDADALKATVVDGVQVAEIEVGPSGYSAQRVVFEAGVPARIIFTRTKEGGCTDKVQIPELGVEATDLPIGEAVAFDFSPEEASEFTFACSMDMVTGMVVVVS